MKTAIRCRSGAPAFIAAIGLMTCAAPSAFAQDETKLLDTETNQGEIIIFHGPDDLHLDPDTVIIAVDVFGDDEVEVNGVTFLPDKSDDTATGVAEANGVTVTTTATNQIDAWSATTTFEGADQDSADNLAIVMESIRWEGAPNPVTIEIEGLPPGEDVEVQLLTNEGRGPARYRVWDITVEDELVADNISSIGRLNEDEWDETNSAAYRGVFTATQTGTLNIVMAQDLGGDPFGGVDNNPILNAIVIHSLAPNAAQSLWGDLTDDLMEATADGWDLTVIETNPIAAEGDAEGLSQFAPSAWSYYASDQREVETFVVTPLLVKNEEGIYTVAAVGDPHIPEDPGIQESIPFQSDPTGELFDISGATSYHIAFLGQQPDGANDVAGGIIPFSADGGPGMFAMNTAPDTEFSVGDELIEGHASAEGGRNYQFNFTLAWPTGDTDGDGCSDSYEENNGMDKNDPADVLLDPDGDGLSSLSECTKDKGDPVSPFVTKANVADTDGDGLSDGVETGTGVWIGLADTGTDPLKSDTDRDRLSDGAETNTGVFISATDAGTNPHDSDTDKDDVPDGGEVSAGTNPLDPEDFPGSDTIVFNGSIKEILGPDDLHLDASTIVIAVDSFGDEDREVNGVLFLTDRDDDGIAERDGVTVTTTATNNIDGWAAAPGFTGGDGDSALNLSEIMADIRWEGAPNPVNIEISGLDSGAMFEVQILVNEGGDRNRHWDIGVGVDPDIELVVDNFTSEGEAGLPGVPGTGGVWTPDNSFAYTGEFTADGDGIINLVMQREIEGPGGTGAKGTDNNPILQAVVVHRAGSGAPFLITDITASAEQVVFSWNSLPGREYAVEFTADLSNPIWIEVDDGVGSEGTTTSFTDDDPERVGVPEGYYRVRQQ